MHGPAHHPVVACAQNYTVAGFGMEPSPTPQLPQPLHRLLYFQVLLAIAIGVIVGHFYPELGASFKPLGDGFIKLIKMMIAPVIFCTVVLGIAGMESMKSVGRTGLLALLYFLSVSTLALVIGLVVVNVVEPGVGMDATFAATDQVTKYREDASKQSVVGFLLNIIPTTFIDAFAKGEILQVLLLALLFGFALHAAGERGRPVFQLVNGLSQVLFKIIDVIMKLAPIGAFGAMAFTIGSFGIAKLADLVTLMACFYTTCVLFILLVLGSIARLHGFSVLRFIRYIKDELLIVLGTSSSETVLPRMMDKLEQAGCARPVVGLVIPTGYSFNLDGTAIYLTMAAIFLAQATNTPLSMGDQLSLLAVLLVTSKGAAAVTGGGFIVLAATLSSTGTIPVESLALILGIDRFMSEARALTNLIGNGVATVVVARWCRALDSRQLEQQLHGESANAKQPA
jgi:aerobic C4-dicarboxylate transport protein